MQRYGDRKQACLTDREARGQARQQHRRETDLALSLQRAAAQFRALFWPVREDEIVDFEDPDHGF